MRCLVLLYVIDEEARINNGLDAVRSVCIELAGCEIVPAEAAAETGAAVEPQEQEQFQCTCLLHSKSRELHGSHTST